MVKFWRLAAGTAVLLAAAAAQAVQLAYEPVGLGWSAGQVERAGAAQMDVLTGQAQQAGLLGCRMRCDRLAHVFARLVVEARTQTARSAALPWSLTVLRSPGVDAMAMPNGQVLISETFVDQRLLSDEALAFVLAHEMAHSILEHERQALTFARMLLPKHVERSVDDMYVELDHNIGLLKAMEPVMQQGEYEADELGMLLASAAGYDPDRQLAFVEQECRADTGRMAVVASHPPACKRLQALQSLLPLARRQRLAELSVTERD